MPRENCKSDVDQSLAQVIGVPGSSEKPVFNEARSEPQGVIFLRIANIVEKDADRVATKGKPEYPRLQRYMPAYKQVGRDIISPERHENEKRPDPKRQTFLKSLIRIARFLTSHSIA